MRNFFAILSILTILVPVVTLAQVQDSGTSALDKRKENVDTRQENRGDVKENIQSNFKSRLTNVYNRIKIRVNRRYDRLSDIQLRIQSVIDKMSEQGKDVSSAQASLDLAVDYLAEAKNLFLQTGSLVDGLTNTDDARGSLLSIKDLVKQSHNQAKASRDQMKTAIKNLKKLRTK